MLWVTVLVHALSCIKVAPGGDGKSPVSIKLGEPAFNFKVEDVSEESEIAVKAEAVSTTRPDQKVSLEFAGKVSGLQEKLAETTFSIVPTSNEVFKVKVTAEDKTAKKSKTLKYKFTALPQIKADYVAKKYNKNLEDFDYLKIENGREDAKFEIVKEGKNWPEQMDVKVVGNDVKVTGKPKGKFPQVKFHITKEEGDKKHRSITYELKSRPKGGLSKGVIGILVASTVLIVIMIFVMAYFYFTNKKSQSNSSGQPPATGPLFTTEDKPCQISLPPTLKAATVDLRGTRKQLEDRI